MSILFTKLPKSVDNYVEKMLVIRQTPTMQFNIVIKKASFTVA